MIGHSLERLIHYSFGLYCPNKGNHLHMLLLRTIERMKKRSGSFHYPAIHETCWNWLWILIINEVFTELANCICIGDFYWVTEYLTHFHDRIRMACVSGFSSFFETKHNYSTFSVCFSLDSLYKTLCFMLMKFHICVSVLL